MHHILYLSQVRAALSENDLRALLVTSRAKNEARNITGILVYCERQFMQLLEGEEANVAQLYATLAQDPRHTGLIKLADKPITQRSFAGWSMAFAAVSPEHFTALRGYLTLAQVQFPTATLSVTDSALLHMAQAFVCGPAV
jgi:hypothetical protein